MTPLTWSRCTVRNTAPKGAVPLKTMVEQQHGDAEGERRERDERGEKRGERRDKLFFLK